MGRKALRLLVERKPRKPRRSRRAVSWIRVSVTVALAAAAGAGAAGALLFSARGRPARIETVRAGAAVRRAELLVREPAPEAAEHLGRLLRRAEADPPPGTGAEVWEEIRTAVWAEALRFASLYAVEEVGRREQARLRWSALEGETARALDRARVRLRTPGLGRRAASELQYAEVDLAAARRFAADGAHDRANDAAAAALARVAAIEHRWLDLHARFSDPELLSRWRRLVSETLAESRRSGRPVLIVDKLARRLDVYSAERRRETFAVELGAQGLSRKLHSGDRATPEGRYRVTTVKRAPDTRYYKALLIDYPNSEDRRRFSEAKRRGEIPSAAGIGGLIEIHGDGGRGQDWTDGCVALTNGDMDRLFRWVGVGTVVTIVGTVP